MHNDTEGTYGFGVSLVATTCLMSTGSEPQCQLEGFVSPPLAEGQLSGPNMLSCGDLC